MSATDTPRDAETATPTALAPPRRRSLPRWVRIVLMGTLLLGFFLGSPVVALVIFPLLRLFSTEEEHRRRCTYVLHRGMKGIAAAGRFVGIAGYDDAVLPASVDPKEPYVLVSNHPTFVDMILVLGSFEHLTCVTAGKWSRHWALGRLLRSTNYLPGPGSGMPESEHMLETMVAHLRKGHPLLVFPEGQRSLGTQLRRFRRGAVEAATQADAPIVPLFIAIDRPYLTKDVSLWKTPREKPHYGFEWFDVVRPREHGGDARRIHDALVARYDARFEVQRARHLALAAVNEPGSDR